MDSIVSSASPAKLAPRKSQPSSQLLSCQACRRRKVRCNKLSPCDRCVQSGLDCVLPGGRKPRRTTTLPYSELMTRLHQLERLIQQADEEKTPKDQTESSPEVSSPTSHFGQLVIAEDQGSRYVGDDIYVNLMNEVRELHNILEYSESSNDSSPQSNYAPDGDPHSSFLFGHYSLRHSLHDFHPDSANIMQLWGIFEENVIPLCPIFHKPSIKKLVVAASESISVLDKNSEAALFTMYLAAAATMTPAQYTEIQLGESREALVKRFRFAAEQAFSRANLLNTESTLLLQSTVLYLLVIRGEDHSRFAWSLTGLALRLAQSLGLNREKNNVGLKPFEVEMRRRLWWHVYLLDYHLAEYHGSEYAVVDGTYDTQIPQNINDDDIFPEMEEPPPDREGFTEMTFCLLRCELARSVRRLHLVGSNLDIAAREAMTQELNQRIEEQFLKYCNLDDCLQWITATAARLMLAKLWLAIHKPSMNVGDESLPLDSSDCDNLLLTAIEVVEFQWLLQTNPQTQKFVWLIRAHMQWQAMALVLTQLSIHPTGPLADRAWNAVRPHFDAWANDTEQKNSIILGVLSKLYMKAETARREVADGSSVMPFAI